MSASVLLVDDDTQVRTVLQRAFQRAGYDVLTAIDGTRALDTYARDAADLVILDLGLPDIPGLDVLQRLRAIQPNAAIIVLTGQADLETAVAAMRAGAENFLAKPVDIQHLYAAAERALEKVQLRSRTTYLEEAHGSSAKQAGSGVGLANAPVMRAVDERIALVAPTDTTVLLLGETGTGKNWFARRVHALSTRAKGPFVEVNCASLSATFLESELFGHEKGAFTDARTMKRGLFEVASEGTLFLDEIGDLAPELQPKLLRALESRQFRRLGGTRDLTSSARLIAATNRNLQNAVADGRFREDLYYRIAVLPIELPPLRTWDIPGRERLAADLLHQLAGGHEAAIDSDALQRIAAYHWPGNIREMRNVLERALILAGPDAHIRTEHLPAEVARAGGAAGPAGNAGALPVDLTLQELERQHIVRVLEHCGGNRTRAARMLGVSRVGLYKKLRRLGIDQRR
ncbi:MAG TPA: sigma-54 dependent transcriptional regulator [Longimicrobiales bacterium]|nr:sigma-54 dependent transcriptional regulator [Longimicrobiales bacterium]